VAKVMESSGAVLRFGKNFKDEFDNFKLFKTDVEIPAAVFQIDILALCPRSIA
jgi:hypothetical protein